MTNPAVQIALVLAIGLAALTLVRLSRLRHTAKFGPPPTGSRVGVFISLCSWSAIYAIIGWWSTQALVTILVAILVLAQVIGFRTQSWSRWQQFRDGGIIASLFVAPLLLFVVGDSSGL